MYRNRDEYGEHAHWCHAVKYWVKDLAKICVALRKNLHWCSAVY